MLGSTTTWLRGGLLLVALAALSGCSVPWLVIKESGPPPALSGVSRVLVKFDYTGMMVGGMGGDKTEAQWVKEKSAEEEGYEKTWADVKGRFESGFMEGIADTSPIATARAAPDAVSSADTAVVTVTLNNLQVGKYIPFATKASEVTVVHTWERGGALVDQIQTHSQEVPALTNPSIFQHIVGLGGASGRLSGKFLDSVQQ
jgi:hypothetical protein